MPRIAVFGVWLLLISQAAAQSLPLVLSTWLFTPNATLKGKIVFWTVLKTLETFTPPTKINF